MGLIQRNYSGQLMDGNKMFIFFEEQSFITGHLINLVSKNMD